MQWCWDGDPGEMLTPELFISSFLVCPSSLAGGQTVIWTVPRMMGGGVVQGAVEVPEGDRGWSLCCPCALGMAMDSSILQ